MQKGSVRRTLGLGLAAMMAGLSDIFSGSGQALASNPISPWRQPSAGSRRGRSAGTAEKRQWNEENPNGKKALRQYQRRYRNAGTSKARFPFSDR